MMGESIGEKSKQGGRFQRDALPVRHMIPGKYVGHPSAELG